MLIVPPTLLPDSASKPSAENASDDASLRTFGTVSTGPETAVGCAFTFGKAIRASAITIAKAIERRDNDGISESPSKGNNSFKSNSAMTSSRLRAECSLRVSSPSANFSFGSFASILACPRHVRLGGNLRNAGCPVLPVEGIGLDVIQAPKPEPRIMRYEFTDFE